MANDQDIVYGASLDDSEVLEAYKRIIQGAAQSADRSAKAFDKMAQKIEEIADGLDTTGKKGKKSFEDLDKNIASSTVNLDRFKQTADEVIQTLVRMGVQAAKAFAEAVQGGVELNRQAELVQLSLTQVFQGNEKAAQAFLELIDETAVKMGANRQELRQLAKGLLPDVGDIELTNKLVGQLIILGRDAGASFSSIRIAAEEALSGGNLQSLARRLNLGSVVPQAEKYAETMGTAAGLALALEERINKTGLSTEVTAGSLEVLANTLQAQLVDLQTILGEAPAQELKEQIMAILGAFKDNRTDIETVVRAFGEFAAKVIEVVGSGIVTLFDTLDFEELEMVADNFSRLVIKAELLAKILFDPELLNGLLEGTNAILEALNAAVTTAAQLQTIVSAEQARDLAEARKAAELSGVGVKGEGGIAQIAPGLVTPFLGEEERAQIAAAGQEAFNKEFQKSLELFKEAAEAEEELEEKITDRGKAREKASEQDLADANAIIELGKAQEEATDAAERAAQAQKDINEQRGALATDLSRELLRLNRKLQNDIIEDDIKAARRREKIALDFTRNIEDITRKNQQRIDDLRGDLTNEETELAEKKADERLQIERDKGKALADAEKNLVAELLRIQEQFLASGEEAERNNDVQSFLAAVRRRDQQVTEAKRERDETVSEAQDEAKEREQALKESYEKDLANLRSANKEKLAELQTQLNRELEEARIANERKLEDARISEAQEAEDRKRRFDNELNEFRIKESQRRLDLEKSLQDEFAILEEASQKKIKLAKLTADQIIKENKRAIESAVGKFGLGKKAGFNTPEEETGLFLPVIARQSGGPLVPNKPTLVGERGPEVIIPQGPGFVLPNTFFRPPMSAGGGGVQNVFNDNRSSSVNMPVGPDIATNPQVRNLMMQIARQVMAEAFR